MPEIEKIVVTLHRQTTRVATALGHRHHKVGRGIEPRPTLPNNQGGSALSIVIRFDKRFSTASEKLTSDSVWLQKIDKQFSLTSKKLSSDFRKTHLP